VAVPVGAGVVSPGDWLVGDADGVVVIGGSRMAAALEAARSRAHDESVAMAAIEAGSSSLAALGIGTAPAEGLRGSGRVALRSLASTPPSLSRDAVSDPIPGARSRPR
jgi:hypothetical protein